MKGKRGTRRRGGETVFLAGQIDWRVGLGSVLGWVPRTSPVDCAWVGMVWVCRLGIRSLASRPRWSPGGQGGVRYRGISVAFVGRGVGGNLRAGDRVLIRCSGKIGPAIPLCSLAPPRSLFVLVPHVPFGRTAIASVRHMVLCGRPPRVLGKGAMNRAPTGVGVVLLMGMWGWEWVGLHLDWSLGWLL